MKLKDYKVKHIADLLDQLGITSKNDSYSTEALKHVVANCIYNMPELAKEALLEILINSSSEKL